MEVGGGGGREKDVKCALEMISLYKSIFIFLK